MEAKNMKSTSKLTELIGTTKENYIKRTQRSGEAYLQAKQYFPGGDTRSVVFYQPYPTYITRGSGAVIYDLDNNNYIDFLNNYTSLVLGHAHSAVVEVVNRGLLDGMIFGAPHITQTKLAASICNRLPGIERIRFCNSGTEAVMHAIRTARIFTGKPLIIKMEGGYHGSADTLEISITPDISDAGPSIKPIPVLESHGIPEELARTILIAPFNNFDIVNTLLDEHSNQVAAILVEPMMGSAGAIPPLPGYLQALRRLASKYNCLLIFDEIQTMRFHLGGAQAYYDVIPDLTALGKIIGGGFPIGAFGGKAEIMSIYDPEKPGSISHSGTFNGHPLIMAAGTATLEILDQSAIDHLNELADKMVRAFRDIFARYGINAKVTGAGSILNIHFTNKPVTDYRSAKTISKDLTQLLHLMLLERGIYSAKRGMFNLSTPMGTKEIDVAIEALDDCMQYLYPALAEAAPELLV
jgi:glutamate-1-semialdehyde 2,1-aminomutase